MTVLFLFLLSILPALILLHIFEKQDKGEKEPRKLKIKVFVFGIVTVFIAGAVEMWLDVFVQGFQLNHWLYIFIVAFIIAAMLEELMKFLVVKKVAYDHHKFNEVMDGITYAVLASMGFAVLENMIFVMSEGFGVGVMRAMLAVPAHALFSGIMGFYIGKAKFAKTPWDSRNLLWKGLLIGILYHGLYDFFLLSGNLLVFAVVPLMLLMVAHLRNLIKRARYNDKLRDIIPRKFGWRRGLSLVLGVILAMVGIVWIVGAVSMFLAGEIAYTYLLTYGILPLIMFTGSFFLIKKYAKK